MSPKDEDGMANSVDLGGLIWVYTVCPNLSVRKLYHYGSFSQDTPNSWQYDSTPSKDADQPANPYIWSVFAGCGPCGKLEIESLIIWIEKTD